MKKAVHGKSKLQRDADPGKVADARVKKLMKARRGMEYKDALAEVFRKDPKLFKAWHKAPKADPLRELKRLAAFLNSEDTEALRLRADLAPVIDYESAPEAEIRQAADRLAKAISRVNWVAECIKVRRSGKEFLRPFFYIMSAGWYGTIANAIRTGTLHRLKRCRWEDCRRFFATQDHRVDYCLDKGCFAKHEARRVKMYRVQKAEEQSKQA